MSDTNNAQYLVRYFVDDDKTEEIPFPDAVSALHSAICWDHQRSGFVEGIKVGIQLATEEGLTT